MRDFLIQLAGQNSIYLPREMNVEPELSLVQDESSVRYFFHILVIAKSIYNYPCEYI